MPITTNIDQLPQILGQFVAAANADWRDTIQFNWAAGTANAGQPIDISAIDFYAQVRDRAGPDGTYLLIDASTVNGLIINGGQLGTLRFAVPQTTMAKLTQSLNLVIDIVAVGANAAGVVETLNLSPTPSTLTVNPGVTFIGT